MRLKLGGCKSIENEKFVNELAEQRKLADTKRLQLEKSMSALSREALSEKFTGALDKAVAKLKNIDSHRSKVDDGSIPAKAAIGFYTQHNALMLNTISETSNATDDGKLRSSIVAYVNFLQGKERAGIERAVMSKTFAADRFADGDLRKFGTLVTAQDTYFDVFRSQATSKQVSLLEKKMSSPIVAEVQKMRDAAFEVGVVTTDGFGIDPAQWFK